MKSLTAVWKSQFHAPLTLDYYHEPLKTLAHDSLRHNGRMIDSPGPDCRVGGLRCASFRGLRGGKAARPTGPKAVVCIQFCMSVFDTKNIHGSRVRVLFQFHF